MYGVVDVDVGSHVYADIDVHVDVAVCHFFPTEYEGVIARKGG